MEQSPTYFRIRSVARVLARLVPIAIALWALALALSVTVDNRPSCPVTIVSPTQWEWTDSTTSISPLDLTECVAPAYMSLHPDGTWSWVG
jgi:hypothetical protein